MGRNKTNPPFVCPRCRYETPSAYMYRKHLFERQTPCLPHADGYMEKNYQPMLILKKFAREIEHPDTKNPRKARAAKRFFKTLNVAHWSLKMIPEDERKLFENILNEMK